MLFLVLATLGVASQAEAFFGRFGCCNKKRSCETTTSCSPCKKQKSCGYQVIEHEPCNPPTCVRYETIRIEEPAICHKYCKWECAPNCVIEGPAEDVISTSEAELQY